MGSASRSGKRDVLHQQISKGIGTGVTKMMLNKRLTTFAWTALLTGFISIPLVAQNASPVAPKAEQLRAAVNSAYAMFKGDTSGKNADYIPYLAQVNSKLFGIAVVTT